MSEHPKWKPPELLRVQQTNFIGEQDGPPEPELKIKLIALFKSAAWVRVAYLARVTCEDTGPMHVALCVRGQPGQNRIFGQRAGEIFAAIFGSHEHIDVLWNWDFPPVVAVFLVRNSQTIETLGPDMRQAIWRTDPDISIPAVISLDAQVDESVATERFQTVILSSFGGAALLLAVLGVYGVLDYSLSLRRREFGIRIVFGSSRARLASLLLLDASYPMVGGIALGLLGAALATPWVRSLLYETSAADPWAIGLSVAVLVAAALAASLFPAREASSIDPMAVLTARSQREDSLPK